MVIASEDIERFGDRTLADVLQRLRGFYIRDDRNYTYLGARGFSRPTDYDNRVLLLPDGIPLNEGLGGRIHERTGPGNLSRRRTLAAATTSPSSSSQLRLPHTDNSQEENDLRPQGGGGTRR